MYINKRNVSALGIVTALLSFFVFSLLDSLVKVSSQWFSVVEMAFFQRFFALIIVGPILISRSLKTKSVDAFRMQVPFSHIIRGFLMFFFSLLFNYTFTVLPLTTAYSIIFMLPIITALMAFITVREHISPLAWIGIIGGFIGMLLVLRPGIAPWNWGYLAAFGAVCFEAPFFILARKYHNKEFMFTTVFYPQLIACVLFFLVFNISGVLDFNTIDYSKIYFVFLMSVANIAAQMLMNYSLRLNDTNISTSMQYSQVIYGLVLGYLFFNEIPNNPLLIVGTCIILMSGYMTGTGRLPFFKRHKAMEETTI